MDDMIGIVFLCLLIMLAINGFLASQASNIAVEKGYEKRKWFHMCFWLGLPSYLMIIAMPNHKLLKQNETMIALQEEMVSRLGDGDVTNSKKEFELPEL